ncbi:MAG TPA: BatA domain-containing protein [Gemmatimonadaceae bacterium]
MRTPRLTAARGAAIVACLVAFSAGVAAAQNSSNALQVKVAVKVAADSVRVGDPFRVTIGIRAPVGATIDFPRELDSSGAVQSLDPVNVRSSADTSAFEQYADYRVAAWDVGLQPIRLDDIIVKLGSATRRIPVTGATIFVKSVLPADSAKRIPKPPRDLFEVNPFPWWLWALLAAVAVGLILLYWWWKRRRRRATPISAVDPFKQAEADFERIERLALLEAGERGRYVTLVIEVLRDYLAARHTRATLSLTSTELQRTARELPTVPEGRLTRVLTDADLIKFARRAVSTDRAKDLGREARAIVAVEHAAMPAETPATPSPSTPTSPAEAA